MTAGTQTDLLSQYVLRLADDLMINSQRLAEYMTHAPELEEELAIANVALDNLGVAQRLYEYAGRVAGNGATGDDFAFLRSERQFTNCLLVEQPHADFAHVIVRQFFLDAWHAELWPALKNSSDPTIAAIAAKAEKEARYHWRHSASWIVRLGDGTSESSARAQRAVSALWRFAGELLVADEVDVSATDAGIGVSPADLAPGWNRRVEGTLEEAQLQKPDDPFVASGGRTGRHTEHLGHLLAEMQHMQRSHPGLEW